MAVIRFIIFIIFVVVVILVWDKTTTQNTRGKRIFRCRGRSILPILIIDFHRILIFLSFRLIVNAALAIFLLLIVQVVVVVGAADPIGLQRLVRAVQEGRLGASSSIRGRMLDLGGDASWRSPGTGGTTVTLTVPTGDMAGSAP